MNGRKSDCFVCNTDPDRSVDAPWSWTKPRALCPSHKVDLVLEDGQLLESVLIRVRPLGSSLEGNFLAWIFNPVFLEVRAGQKIKAWTDFAYGGTAVFEDRFSAKSYFEFRAFECAPAVDLLYTLRLAAASGTTLAATQDLLAFLVAVEKSRTHAAQDYFCGSLEGLRDLIHVWNFQLQLNRLRRSKGHLWPESFTDFCDWTKECRRDAEEPQPGTEASFFRELNELALRRFPAIN